MNPAETIALYDFVALLAMFGGFATMIGGVAWALKRRRQFRQEWVGYWNDRECRLVKKMGSELWIDGVLVHTHHASWGPMVEFAVQLDDPEHGRVPAIAGIQARDGAGHPSLRIGDDEVVMLAAEVSDALTESPAVQLKPSLPAPQNKAEPGRDPRLVAVGRLVAAVRAQETDPEALAAVDHLDERIRELLGSLQRLDAAADAHAALGGDSSDVGGVQTRVEEQLTTLTDALRRLHLASAASSVASTHEELRAAVVSAEQATEQARAAEEVGAAVAAARRPKARS